MQRACVLLLVACSAMSASAYRPFVSTDAAVADPGDVEVEFGAIGFRRGGGRTSLVAPTVIGNLGLARDLELVGEFKLVNDLSHAEEDRESATGTGADNSALVGAIWEVKAPPPLRELSLDVGLRHGISRTADEWSGTAGFTIAFPLHGREEP